MTGKLQLLIPELSFVPKHLPPTDSDVEVLKNFLYNSQKLFVLTGAGISTESGIPDYRSDKVGLYARSNHKPVQHKQFLNSNAIRQRYWARNYVGWDRFSKCNPNVTHYWLKDWETIYSRISVLVTQNVDNLHFKAGSKNVIELHGTAHKVVCLNCNNTYSRHDVQCLIKDLNPSMNETTTMVRPDGDVEIPEDKIKDFTPPLCGNCGGILKPDIVFFGDNVPKSRVIKIQDYISNCDGVLVLGSSLSVYSGYRIILQASEANKKIVIVNIGATRADKYANLKIAAKCGDILTRISTS